MEAHGEETINSGQYYGKPDTKDEAAGRAAAYIKIKEDAKCQGDPIFNKEVWLVNYNGFQDAKIIQVVHKVATYNFNITVGAPENLSSHFILIEDHFLGHVFNGQKDGKPHFHAICAEEVELGQEDGSTHMFYEHQTVNGRTIVGVRGTNNRHLKRCFDHYFYPIGIIDEKQQLGGNSDKVLQYNKYIEAFNQQIWMQQQYLPVPQQN